MARKTADEVLEEFDRATEEEERERRAVRRGTRRLMEKLIDEGLVDDVEPRKGVDRG